jgi:hypothetical protein
MHLWHKWKTIEKSKGTATVNGCLTRWKDEEQPIVAELQRCEKCGAERGLMHMLNGETRAIDPEFIRSSNDMLTVSGGPGERHD